MNYTITNENLASLRQKRAEHVAELDAKAAPNLCAAVKAATELRLAKLAFEAANLLSL